MLNQNKPKFNFCIDEFVVKTAVSTNPAEVAKKTQMLLHQRGVPERKFSLYILGIDLNPLNKTN